MSRKPKRPTQNHQMFGPSDIVNREPRVTSTILIDCTTSLRHDVAKYFGGLTTLYADCRKHPATRSSAFVSTTLCGGLTTAPAPYVPFAAAEVPTFELVGGSPGGSWLLTGVNHLRAEHARMDADGVPSNKDVMLVIGDFHWDDPATWDEAIDAYRRLENERPQFNGFMVMAGPNPNRALASRISRKRPAVSLSDLKVDELFRWVSVVMQQASMSRPGQAVDLPTPAWTLTDDERR